MAGIQSRKSPYIASGACSWSPGAVASNVSQGACTERKFDICGSSTRRVGSRIDEVRKVVEHSDHSLGDLPEENKRATASRSKTASTPPTPRRVSEPPTAEPVTEKATTPTVPDAVAPPVPVPAPEPVPESAPPAAPTSAQDETAGDTDTDADTSPTTEDSTPESTTTPPEEALVWTDPVDADTLAHALTVFADADADPKNPYVQQAASAAAREVGAPISRAALQLADDRLAEKGLLTVEDQDAKAMEVGVE